MFGFLINIHFLIKNIFNIAKEVSRILRLLLWDLLLLLRNVLLNGLLFLSLGEGIFSHIRCLLSRLLCNVFERNIPRQLEHLYPDLALVMRRLNILLEVQINPNQNLLRG